jgi:hypothetical protein
MELVIGLIVLVVIGVFVFRPKKEADAVVEAPYKVEEKGFADASPVAEQATQAVVESIAPAKKKPAAKKAPAAKKTAARKPRAK